MCSQEQKCAINILLRIFEIVYEFEIIKIIVIKNFFIEYLLFLCLFVK